jgi:carboxyl-terminal processing protease
LESKRHPPRLLSFLLTVLGTAFLVAPVHATSREKLDELRHQADQMMHRGQWARACDIYDNIAPRERNIDDVRNHLICLRHVNHARRLQDRTFRDQVRTQPLTVTLRLYEEILAKIQANYVDHDKADLTQLFQQGLDGMRMALRDELFLRTYLRKVDRDTVEQFRSRLAEMWQDTLIGSRAEARDTVRDVAFAAQKALGLKPALVVLEFACGACDGLDEYSGYLTPAQLDDLYASLKGEFVGIGIQVSVEDGKAVISQVVPGSPAALATPPLKEHDRIVAINRRAVGRQSEDAVNERLRGESGSTVELDVLSPGRQRTRRLVLTRQAVVVRSVVTPYRVEEHIGYVQLSGFQETTLDELNDALARLQMEGMKVLILDLRGNQGGLFNVAVQVAERFLPAGVIVSTSSPVRDENRKFEANNPAAFAPPMVVLIDGDTASAAEIVAGALKDNQRATLVGEPTFGKGRMQRVLKLATVPAGLKITLAKFFSPNGQAYDGMGIVPRILVPRGPSPGIDDQLLAARSAARQLLSMQ